MRWKNGMGETAEIDREPAGEEGYLWRLSQAWVANDSPFSAFPGYDRWLAVWQGDGLLLNGLMLPPFSPRRFRGEDEVSCRRVGSDVVDVGLIFDRTRVDAAMSVVEGAVELSAAGVYYLFDIASGDTLKISEPGWRVAPRSFLISVRER